MGLDKLNILPKWDDEKMNRHSHDEVDEWKHKKYYEAIRQCILIGVILLKWLMPSQII